MTSIYFRRFSLHSIYRVNQGFGLKLEKKHVCCSFVQSVSVQKWLKKSRNFSTMKVFIRRRSSPSSPRYVWSIICVPTEQIDNFIVMRRFFSPSASGRWERQWGGKLRTRLPCQRSNLRRVHLLWPFETGNRQRRQHSRRYNFSFRHYRFTWWNNSWACSLSHLTCAAFIYSMHSTLLASSALLTLAFIIYHFASNCATFTL